MSINLPIVTKFDKRGIANATRSLQDFGKLAGTIAAAATAAVTGVAVASVKEFAKFDSKLQQSVSIMGDVSDAMRNDMSDAAREVAKTTTFSAEQAAESFYFLASAGLDAEQSIQALPKVAEFAQAGMFDMAQATDLLTDAQSALGLSVDDTAENMENMERVSDVLVKANTLANASVEQFSTSLTNKAGAALRSLGKDVEEGVAVLAAFADQGIKGEIAGTQLSIVLRDLTTKAIKNKDEFEAMGLQVFDANGEMRNLGDIVANLEDSLVGMSDETQKATLLQAGFSDKSLASIQALLGTSDAIKSYEKDLRAAGGTTENVADKQLQTMSAQFDLLKSRVADIGIEIGSGLAPKLLELADDMGPVIEKAGPAMVKFFESIAPIIQGAIASLPSILTGLTNFINFLTVAIRDDLLPAVTTTFGWIKDNIPTIATFAAVLGTLTGGVYLFSNASKIAAAAQLALQAVMAVNPLYLMAIAIAAVAAGIVYLATQTTFFQDTWKVVTEFFESAYKSYIEPVIDGFADALTFLYKRIIKPIFSGAMLVLGLYAAAWEFIYKTVIKPVIDVFSKLITDFFEGVIKPRFEAIQEAFQTLGDFFVFVYDTIIKPAFDAFEEGINWLYENVIRPASESIVNAFEFVGEKAEEIFDKMKNFIKNTFEALVGLIREPLNSIIRFMNKVIGGINSIKVDIPDWVPEWGGKTIGFNIAKIPQLAEGGIVMPRPGGVLANLAEAGKPEAVIPLDRMGSMGGTTNNIKIVVNAGMGADGQQIGQKIVDEIIKFERSSGKVFARA